MKQSVFHNEKKVEYALIIAGGASKRMVENKNWIDFNGKPMLRQVLHRLYESGIDKVTVCYVEDGLPKQSLDIEEDEVWEDEYQHLGQKLPWTAEMWQTITLNGVDDELLKTIRHPLLGIREAVLSAAKNVKCKIAMLISNDVPILDPALVSALHGQLDSSCSGVMAQMSDGQPAPLLSLVKPKELLSRMEDGYAATVLALANNEKTPSTTSVMIQAGVKVVDIATLTASGVDMTRLQGANTPEELEGLKRRWKEINQ
ncbi:MAG: NTP transferase domain-containing protein [Euryarchaeota archaeon]|jgi:molybdopterin-guanine dinucleotide biosynthesis protein A|nr:NTP transferase domain-containing protein [Euryarchaeota archaeon]